MSKMRVCVVCTNGDMFSRTLEYDSPLGALYRLAALLDPDIDEELTFEAFGRMRTVLAEDIESIEFKRVGSKS